jgi:hypothetical protein
LLTNLICSTKQLTLHRKFSASSFHRPHDGPSSATHVPHHLNPESDQGDASEEENEEEWFDNLPGVHPGAQIAKVSHTLIDEVRASTCLESFLIALY